MNLDKYQALIGTTVPTADTVKVTAQINRTRSILENILGYTLSPSNAQKNFYNELGKSKVDCTSPSQIAGDMLPADDVVGSYRLFKYNDAQDNYLIDPFTQVNAIKLVYVSLTDIYTGYTVKTFSGDEMFPKSNNGWGKWLTATCTECECLCDCTGDRMLAVDGTWLNEDCLPGDLMYVWADIITSEVDCNKDIKSESIMTHSVTYADKKDVGDTGLGLTDYQYKILQKYAGPNSSILDTRYI